MKQLIPRISIENCKKALEFYQNTFGGEIKNAQLADGIEMFKGHEGKYIHAELHINEHHVIFFNDVFNPNYKLGNHMDLTLIFDSEAEIREIFNKLSVGGQVMMELQDTFWNAKHGKVRDKYGIVWELDHPKQ